MNRLERIETSMHEGTNPDLWTAHPEVNSHSDLALSAQVLQLLSSSLHSSIPSFIHHHQGEDVVPLWRSLRLRNKARLDYRRMERIELPEKLPLLREEENRKNRMDIEAWGQQSLNLQKPTASLRPPRAELASGPVYARHIKSRFDATFNRYQRAKWKWRKARL